MNETISMKEINYIDYDTEFNAEFLKKVEIPEDSPKWNLRNIIEKMDHKNINTIFERREYVNLNIKEINILKSFIKSMDLHESKSQQDKSDKTIKEIINNILILPIDELVVYVCENQLNGLFNISTGYFNKEVYLGIGQGKNNISNSKCYSNDKFIEIYKKLIKMAFELYIPGVLNEEILNNIINYEILINKNKMDSVKRRDVMEAINIYKINDIKFKNFNFQNVINLILKKGEVKYLRDDIIFDEKKPLTFYSLIDQLFIEPNFRYYIIWCFLCQIGGYLFNELNDIKFELIQIIKGIKKQMTFNKKKIVLCNELIGHLISKEYLSFFDPTIKINTKIIIEYLKETFHKRLIQNRWMDEITKKKL
jgi:predicted metalloendopeptidase